jgi:hypothetical protein
MTAEEILKLRLANLGLTRARFKSPADVVAWFGAVQAQDYLGSLWAIGLRLRNATEHSVEAALAARALIRCWPMRGTLHFVAADDARWMTQLHAPRVLARNAARMKREVDVDAAVIGRSREVVVRALEGGRRLERATLYEMLEARRIRTGNSRGLHILLWLAMEGTICLTGRSGKQHAFALLDEWIPTSKQLEREAALAELSRRYFTSHGPATLHDFMWWAGITAKDARAAIDGAGLHLVCQVFEGRAYWSATEKPTLRRVRTPNARTPLVRLLPAYDEFTVAYRDRSLLVTSPSKMLRAGLGLLNPVVVVNGKVLGAWSRRIAKGAVRIEVKLLRALNRMEHAGLLAATRAYGAFLGFEPSLHIDNAPAQRR